MADCLKLARENNPALEIACLRTLQAVETKNEVRSGLLPNVSVEGVWDNRNDSLSGDLTQFQGFKSNKAVGISAKQSLFDFGASWSRLRASYIRITASEMDQNSTVLEVEEQVRSAYIQVLQQEKMVRVIKGGIHTLEQQLSQSQDLFKQGIVKHSDVLAVHVQLTEKRQRLLKTKNIVTTHRMGLNRLIGLPLFDERPLQEIKKTPEFCICFAPALEHALNHRTDLTALCKHLEALRLDHRASNLSHLPHIYAFGNGNYSSSRSTVSAGIGLSLPLYEGGRKRAQSSKLYTEIRALRATQSDLENVIALDVKSTCMQFDEIRESLRLDQETVSFAEENLKNNRDLYQEGQASINDVLMAEEGLSHARMNYFGNYYRYHTTLAHLTKITGGFEPCRE